MNIDRDPVDSGCGDGLQWLSLIHIFAKGNEELRDTVWAEVMKLYDEGEIDKLAEQYGVADMLCLGDEEAADKTEESTDAAEENADSDEAADADAAAVSYTHLDVYKRQAEDNTAPRPLSKVSKMSSNRYLKGDFYIVYEKYRL